MSNRVTLKDVAARAGVSLTTVSLFLNGNSTVCSNETAERIRSAVAELNYVIRPRAAAVAAAREALAAGGGRGDAVPAAGAPGSGVAVLDTAGPWQAGTAGGVGAAGPRPAVRTRSRNIGIVFSPDQDLLAPTAPTGSSSFRSDLIWRGAAQEAEAEEYGLLSYPARVRNGAAFESFLDGAAAGVVLAASNGRRDERAERLAAAGLPVILLGRFLDIPDGCGAVYAYERDTVDLAMRHLEALGHRRIAHLAGPISTASSAEEEGAEAPAASDVAVARLERYERWMRSHGGYDPALVRASETWDDEASTAAASALDAWLSLPEPPTAVFCASAALAQSLIAAARQRGLSVPGDLSVVGVGEGPEDLTTVVMPNELIGREAVRLLLRIIDGVPAASCRLALSVTQLAVGASTAGPRPAAAVAAA